MQSLWMLLAALLFAVTGVTIKLSAAVGFNTTEQVFYRSLVGWLIVSIIMLVRGMSFRTPHTIAHLQRGAASTFAIWLFMYAVIHLPLPTAVTLNFTSPLWIALILTLVFGESISKTMVAALVIGFAGILLLLQPVFTPDKRFDLTIGLLSGVGAAIGALNVRRLGSLREPEWRIFWWFSTIIGAGAAAWMTITQGWRSHPVDSFFWVIAMGSAAAAAQLAQTRAYARGKPLLTANLSYAGVLFSALAGVMIYHDHIPLSGWCAMALIILSGIMATYRTRKGERKPIEPEAPTPQ